MSLLRLARTPAPEIGPDLTVMDAIRYLIDHQAGAAAVTEGGKLVGIFSERDVMKKVVLDGLDPDATRIRDIMTTEVQTTTRKTPVSEAIAHMSKHRIRHLPIISPDGELLGMLSLRYLLHDHIDDVMNQLASLDNYHAADGPGG